MSRYTEVFQNLGNIDFFAHPRVPRPAPADTNEDATPGHLCWGVVGALPQPEVAESEGFEVVNEKEDHVEYNRNSEDVRIENPDTPEDWVEVDRAHKLFFNKTTHQWKEDSNVWSADAEGIGDFSPSSIEFSSFTPLGTETKKRIKLTVTLKNTQRAA